MMPVLSKEWKLSAVYQQFSLPEALVFYIAKNPPSPEVFNKLIKCCKYFWLKNPTITLHDSCYSGDYTRPFWLHWGINGFQNDTQFKMGNVNEKLWIYGWLFVFTDQDNFLTSTFIPKIYRCDLTSLDLSFQMITFADFKFLASDFLLTVNLNETTVKNADGTIVPIEKLIEMVPNLLEFSFVNVRTEEGLQTITSETAAKLVAIKHFRDIDRLSISGIPDSFNIDTFFETPKVSLGYQSGLV